MTSLPEASIIFVPAGTTRFSPTCLEKTGTIGDLFLFELDHSLDNTVFDEHVSQGGGIVVHDSTAFD